MPPAAAAKESPYNPIRVLVADSSQMQLQLLTGALRRRPEFRLPPVRWSPKRFLKILSDSHVDVLLLAPAAHGSTWHDMASLRRIHISFPKIAKILVLESIDRELAVNAFRSGARGLFCFSASQFRSLCKCIQVVHRGQIWPPLSRSDFLINLVSQVPSLRVVNANGDVLVTHARSRSSPSWPRDSPSRDRQGTGAQRTHHQEVPLPDL